MLLPNWSCLLRVTLPFKTSVRPYGLWGNDGADISANYSVFAPNKYDCIVTNIIFDGQARNDVLDTQAQKVQGHNFTTDARDTYASQSNFFFDNTFFRRSGGLIANVQGSEALRSFTLGRLLHHNGVLCCSSLILKKMVCKDCKNCSNFPVYI